MALGIHVDTGSLTFASATPRDARALAWLMEQGASQNTITEFVAPSLSPLLQDLLEVAIFPVAAKNLPWTYLGLGIAGNTASRSRTVWGGRPPDFPHECG